MAPTREWWSDAEVAEYLGISPESVRSWISRHKGEIERHMLTAAADVRAAKRKMPGKGGPRKRKVTPAGQETES
jgi:uncharacterized protein YjcR